MSLAKSELVILKFKFKNLKIHFDENQAILKILDFFSKMLLIQPQVKCKKR